MKYILFLITALIGLQAHARQSVVLKECINCVSESSFANQAIYQYSSNPTTVILFNSITKQVKQYEVNREDPGDIGFQVIIPINIGVPTDLLTKMRSYIDAFNLLKNQTIVIPPSGIPGSVPHPNATIHSVADIIRVTSQQDAFMNWIQARPNFQNFINQSDNILIWALDKINDGFVLFFNRGTTNFSVQFTDGSLIDLTYDHINNQYNIKMNTARDSNGSLFPQSAGNASGGVYLVSGANHGAWVSWLSGLGFSMPDIGSVPARIECYSDGTCKIIPL
jgi:hypothetical protein